MTAVDWAGLSRLVPEIALVVLFIWFTLERDKRSGTHDDKNHLAWREFLSVQRDDFLKALREDNAIYREGMGRIADEVKAATGMLREMNTLLVQHDNQTREFIHRQEKK